ncbi:YbhB/YbcL family Raf kinase inhibitor-like protein [Methanomassiliicoccus luminyensis]|jgi:Raf kinase inhibitor-like YbhB/YbcL family protein|uniref:YbhB/YbcL family Raf kinase inhibitor-like protein n=1 Tax=Methanomassiliicoccus luminyensis TaxID=1080712 RepID=UPI00037CB869|nr:YbhB/YbcL family Raf kinase inhibitor-like protein [Methanomassiliicoccus luminyensis]
MRSKMEEIQVGLGFDAFPRECTCEGEDISPRIAVGGLRAPYIALILDDADAPGGTYTHWLLWNVKAADEIPGDVSKVEQPPELEGASQGITTGRRTGYQGPCPPSGKPHRYYLKVYGLEGPLELEPGATKEMLMAAMEGRVRQYGEAMARFGR